MLIKKIKKNLKDLLYRRMDLVENPLVRGLIRYYYRKLWKKRSGYVDVTHIAIENTTICNAKCEMCAYIKMKREKKVMPFDKYAKIIDIACSENIKRLFLGQLGEPFTDKGIIDKMDYAHKMGMELCSITTNASLLYAEISERLLQYPWGSISFSVDGAEKATYESIRKLDFDVVEKNILDFIALREKKKRLDLRIRMQMVVFERNKQEVEAYRKRWSQRLISGHDEIAFLYATNYAGLTGIDYSDSFSSRRLKVPCGRLWNHMIIVAENGDIPICCWDYNVDNKVGNVFEVGSLKKLWNNRKMREVRKLHVDGKYGAIPLCAECNDNYFVKPHFEVVKV